jgi:hypothetical protein
VGSRKQTPSVPAARKPIDTVRVVWPNTQSPLLPHDNGGVFLWWNGQPQSTCYDITAKTHIPVSLPASVSGFDVRVAFRPSKKVLADPPMADPGYAGDHRFTLDQSLNFSQRYRLTADRMYVEAIGSPRYGGRPNPLVSPPEYTGSTVTIRVNTDFVDMTPWWPKYAEGWSAYESEHRGQASGADVYILGCCAAPAAGGSICVAVVPPLARSAAEVGVHVFFRPADDKYERFDQFHPTGRLQRYLLGPYDDPVANVHPKLRDHIEDGTWLIRCGFELALAKSSKPIVLLYPSPSGLDFGAFEGATFARMAESALRCLWGNEVERLDASLSRFGQQAIGRNRNIAAQGRVTARLGLSGFSASGPDVTNTWRVNRSRIQELYLIDPIARPDPGELYTWLVKTEPSKPAAYRGRNLRIVWGQEDPNRMVGQAVLASLVASNLDPNAHVTVWPPDESSYVVPGRTPYFDHVIHRFPQYRNRAQYPDFFHQYTIFGSTEGEAPGPGRRTFMHRFWMDSGH